jgi:hypothetical protein
MKSIKEMVITLEEERRLEKEVYDKERSEAMAFMLQIHAEIQELCAESTEARALLRHEGLHDSPALTVAKGFYEMKVWITRSNRIGVMGNTEEEYDPGRFETVKLLLARFWVNRGLGYRGCTF